VRCLLACAYAHVSVSHVRRLLTRTPTTDSGSHDGSIYYITMGLDIWTASLHEISDNCGLSVGLERRQIRLRPTTPTLPAATTRAVVGSIVATSGSWGNPLLEHCKLHFTLKQLMERELQGQPPKYRTGGLGRKMQQSIFEVRRSVCQRLE
jgi:hypothetical protein